MSMRHVPILISACVAALSCGAASVSDPVFVTTAPERAVLWSTIPGETATVQLVWPEGAVRGLLTASNGLEVELDDTAATSVDVAFGIPADAAAERVLDVTLAFFDASGEKCDDATCTAQLGWVRGCGETAFDLRAAETAGKPWRRVGKNCVIPRLEGYETVALNGEAITDLRQTHWLGLQMTQRDNVLSLSAGEEVGPEATLTYLPPGVIVTIR